MKWISVNNRLPEIGGRYLIYEKKPPHKHNCAAFDYPYPCCKPNIAYYAPYCKGWSWNSRENESPEPTHWMPLPETPNEVD